jgi:DNA-binding MarR family transcriptional regulator
MSQEKASARSPSGAEPGAVPEDEQMPEEVRLARAAWRSMYRLFRSEEFQSVAAEAARVHEVTEQQQYALLSLPLDPDAGLSMRELSGVCRTTPSYVTSIVDSLEARGLVRRHPDPDDRRRTQVRLTDDGRATVYRTQFLLGTPPSGLQALPLADLRTLAELLERAAAPYPWP